MNQLHGTLTAGVSFQASVLNCANNKLLAMERTWTRLTDQVHAWVKTAQRWSSPSPFIQTHFIQFSLITVCMKSPPTPSTSEAHYEQTETRKAHPRISNLPESNEILCRVQESRPPHCLAETFWWIRHGKTCGDGTKEERGDRHDRWIIHEGWPLG